MENMENTEDMENCKTRYPAFQTVCADPQGWLLVAVRRVKTMNEIAPFGKHHSGLDYVWKIFGQVKVFDIFLGLKIVCFVVLPETSFVAGKPKTGHYGKNA